MTLLNLKVKSKQSFELLFIFTTQVHAEVSVTRIALGILRATAILCSTVRNSEDRV